MSRTGRIQRIVVRIVMIAALSLLLFACQNGQEPGLLPWLQPMTAVNDKQGGEASGQANFKPTELQLQTLVLTMADDYIGTTIESTYRNLRPLAKDADQRFIVQTWIASTTGAVITIAAGPDPSISLLDLLVMVRLQRLTFEQRWMPELWGEDGQPMLDDMIHLEREMWLMTDGYLSDAMRQRLKALIDQWLKENPDRYTVSLVRFDQFLDSETASRSQRERAQGLLREVEQATVAIDDARLFGERLLWFAGRMPIYLSQQAALSAFRLMKQPEIQDTFKALANLQQVVLDLQKQIDQVPDMLATERIAALNQINELITQQRQAIRGDVTDVLNQQRTALVKDFNGLTEQARQTFATAETTAKTTRLLVEDTQQLVIETQKLTASLQTLTTSLGLGESSPHAAEGEPVTLNDVRSTIREATEAIAQLNSAVSEARQLVDSPNLQKNYKLIDRLGDEVINEAFWRLLILIGVFFAGLIALRYLPKPKSKQSSE